MMKMKKAFAKDLAKVLAKVRSRKEVPEAPDLHWEIHVIRAKLLAEAEKGEDHVDFVVSDPDAVETLAEIELRGLLEPPVHQSFDGPEVLLVVGEDGRMAEVPCKPFENCVPALDLKVAAGGWSADQVVEDGPGHYDWVAFDGRTKPSKDIFVAQVVGESMNRCIPNGAWCVWRLNPAGSRQGKVVLAQHRDIQDAEAGGKFTVKVYESEKEQAEDGGWRHRKVTLKPDSTDPSFRAIVLEGLDEGELRIVAELVEVLG